MKKLQEVGVVKTHKDLEVWKNAIKLVSDIYQITKTFPKDQMFSLVNQIQRASISIPSNIAEGAGRNHNKEYIQFLYISLGNLAELETQLIISNNLNFIQNNQFIDLNNKLKLIRSQLYGLINSLKKKP